MPGLPFSWRKKTIAPCPPLVTEDEAFNDKFEYINCPVCGNSWLEDFETLKYRDMASSHSPDYSSIGITNDTYLTAQRCRKCKFVFVNPRIAPPYETLVYNDTKMLTHNKFIDLVDGEKRIQIRKRKLTAIGRVLKALAFTNASLKEIIFLDYGCGYGHSMSLARELEMDTYGIDIDKNRLQYCKNLNLKVASPEEFDNLYPGLKADIIYCENTFEHLINPRGVFSFIRARSKKGTVVYVNGITPRVISIEKRKKQFRLCHFVEHVNYTPVRTLDLFMKQFGFIRLRKRDYQRLLLKDFIKNIGSHIVHNVLGLYLHGTFYRLYEQTDDTL